MNGSEDVCMVDILVQVHVMVYSGRLKWPEMDSKSIWDVKIFVGETSSDLPVT